MSSAGPSSVAESSAAPFFFFPPPVLTLDFAFSSALALVTPLALSRFRSLRCFS